MTPPDLAEAGLVADGISDGEQLCTGCWDNSGHDVKADNDIPAGAPIYWRIASVEHDEWNAYCRRCAEAEALIAASSVEEIEK